MVSAAPIRRPLERIWRATRAARWTAGLGAVSGLVAAGIGSRIVMKLIALADPSTEGAFTDAEATVGEFTLAGTFGLLILGAVAGVMGGFLYLLVRRWLPVPAAWNGVAFGGFTLATVGNPLFDPHNADFQIFEPVLLVVGLFSALFFLNGVLLSGMMDRLYPEPSYTRRRRMERLAGGAIVVISILGGLALAGGTVGMVEDEGTCLSAAGQGNGCAVPASR